MSQKPAPLHMSVPLYVKEQVFIKSLCLPAAIGVYAHERLHTQKISIDITLDVVRPILEEGGRAFGLDNIVCYDSVCRSVRELIAQGHIDFVETLVRDIAHLCLEYDMVKSVDVEVRKLEAITDTQSVGVRLHLSR